LQRALQRSEEGRAASQNSLMQLSERLAELTDRMGREQDLLRRLAEAGEQDRGGIDEASRSHLRNIDVYVTRLVEESTQGRHQLVSELRSEIKLLARTIAAVSDDRR
jgi:hypothetical protein